MKPGGREKAAVLFPLLLVFGLIFLLIEGGADEIPSSEDFFQSINSLIHNGQYTDAKAALEERLSVQDPDELFNVHFYLGYCHHLLQEYTDALSHYEEALALSERNLYLLETAGDLSLSLGVRVERGKDYLLEAAELNSQNPRVFYYLAVYFTGNGELEKAAGYLDKSIFYFSPDLPGLENYLQWIRQDPTLTPLEDTAYLIRLFQNEAALIEGAGAYFGADASANAADYPAALDGYISAGDLLAQSLGTESLWWATAQNHIGLTYWNLGRYTESLVYYQEAISVLERIFGPDHREAGSNYNNVAAVHYTMGEYILALEGYTKALDIFVSAFGEYHPDTAAAYNNIGMVYWDIGDFEASLRYLEKGTEVLASLYGSDNPSVVTGYNNVGLVH